MVPKIAKKNKVVKHHRRLIGAKQALNRQVLKAKRWITRFSLSKFSPYMYIKSSPHGPSRDPY